MNLRSLMQQIGALGTVAVCLMLFAFAPAAARAQFSGPSLEAGSPVNSPLVVTTDPTILYPPDRPLKIGIGDELQVVVFGAGELSAPQRVSLDGTLQLPLIGPIPVNGLTLQEISRLVADRLKEAGMYRDPQVTVTLVDSPNQIVTVSGEMHGIVPVVGHKTLLSVLSAAGQYPATAAHTVIINRPGLEKPIVIDLGTDPSHSARADVPLFAGDTVVVPRTGVVYILGAFKTQGAVPLQQNSPLTLLQATALGGGAAFEGRYGDLRIIRTVGYDRTVIKVDLMRVMKGKEPDPVLQADDIVFLPTNGWKAALTNGGFGAATSVASLLLVALYNR